LLGGLFLPVSLAFAQDGPRPADLVVHNALVTTLWDGRPEAEALAARDGRVLAVGSDEEVLALRGPDTRVLDAGGRRLIPGLVDSHMHPTRGGRFYAAELRWDGVPSLARGLEMVREQAARTPEGEWVRVVGGWSPFQFAERRMPTPAELTEAAPDVPVYVLYLYSRGFLNAAGVRALGLSPATETPPGTRYAFTADGGAVIHAEPHPALLYGTIAALPPLSEEDQALSTRHFYRELNRFGLTSVIDAGGGGHQFPEDYVGTARLAEAGEMPLRISTYLFPQRPGQEAEDFARWTEAYDAGRSAAPGVAGGLEHGFELEGGGEFLAWSAGDFENFMAPRPDLGERDYYDGLKAVTEKLVREGWPLRVHATYDESVSRILDVFEEVHAAERAAGRPGFGEAGGGVRWAVDHAETISEDNVARIAALGGGVAVQARMAYAGEFFAERYGAEAAAHAPPLRMLLDAGVPLGAGTDGTRVASYNPWVALYWLTTGRTAGGTRLAAPENRLSREEALRLYTVGGAWFSQEEGVKGTLEPGRFADFAVLSEDFFEVDEEEIPDIEAVLTVLDGEIVYGADEFAGLTSALPPIQPSWSPVRVFGGYHSAGESGSSSPTDGE
jgi:predicted amidohydrolase YtcJ